MGEPVGALALSYRLSNLGACLLGHLGEGAAPGRPQAPEEEEGAWGQPHGPQGKGRLSLELIPEGDEEQDLAPEPFGLLGPSGHPKPPHSPAEPPLAALERELEIEADVFCPPPMYYTRPPESPRPKPASPASVILAAAEECFPDETVPAPPAVPLVQERPPSRAQEAASVPRTDGSPEQLRQSLSQLPLLNALLVELSLLSGPSLKPQPSSVHPQLAWLYQNAEGTGTSPPCAKSACPCWEEKKSTHRKERGRSASPKLKRNRPDHLKCLSPSFQLTCSGKAVTKMAYAKRMGSPEKNNSKENSPPRRKLTYGLTNTLMLRLQRSNPAMLKVHEKREHRRKKQGELIVEKKGKASSTKGKLLHGSPEHRPKSPGQFDEQSIPDQKVQINENVETLIQSSVDQDCPTTEKSEVTVVKNSDDGKQKDSSEITDPSYKEKSLKVHLPQVFLQDAEALANKIVTEVGKSVEHNDCGISAIHNDSQSNNLQNSHELKNSDDVPANSDNTGYSEDFTNADSLVPSLESQESSLEPLLVNQDESHSFMDSDSKISGSLTAESISPPLPISSAVSPVQSLKKTYDLKSNAKNTAVVFNKLVDDSPPPGSLEKEVATEHMRERGSSQALKNEDLNCNIAKGQSLEKSSSLRTSQVSSYLPSNVSDLDLSGLEESNASEKEKEDDFAMLDITNQCRHISELVANKLPGYTM